MREIKYRQKLKPAYAKFCGEFHYWGFIDGAFHSPTGKNEACGDSEQYAGTKNGIELYEGDVIRDHIGIGVVGWCESNFAFKVRYTGEYSNISKWFADYLESEENSIELIGTVHENPELLEKNND